MPPANWSLDAADEIIPVRNIYAIGWNYALHNEELNRRKDEPLIVFLKSSGSLLDGATLRYPPHTKELHYEGELVALLGGEGYQVSEAEALGLIWGYAPGIDFTLRDVQWGVRGRGQPWFPAKNFRGATAVGRFLPAARAGDIGSRRLQLLVNGIARQDSLLSAMNHGVASLVSLISATVPLLRGDVIFTGTPQGVGECHPGDDIECRIEGLGSLRVKISG